jgi:hypothetical protein
VSLRFASECRHNFNTTAAAATVNAIVAAPGQRVFVYRLLITSSIASTFKLQDTGGNDLSQTFQLGITGGVALDVPFNLDPWWYTGQPLLQGAASAQQGGLGTVSGSIQQGQNLGINFIVTGGPTLGWDIWWDYHP